MASAVLLCCAPVALDRVHLAVELGEEEARMAKRVRGCSNKILRAIAPISVGVLTSQS